MAKKSLVKRKPPVMSSRAKSHRELTDELVAAGRQFLERLDKVMPVSAAMWLYDSETAEWKFVLSTDEIDSLGTRKVYERINRILPEPISALSVVAVSNRDPRINLIRSAFKVEGICDSRFTASSINGHVIDDMLLYRSEQ